MINFADELLGGNTPDAVTPKPKGPTAGGYDFASDLLSGGAQPSTPTPQPIDPGKERITAYQAEQAEREANREALIKSTPSLPGQISEAFTGSKRETEKTRTLPEFRETEEIQGFGPRGLGSQLKLTAGLLSSFSPQAKMDVIKESIPEAQFSQDEKGNIVVSINGEESILNKPGMSGQDVVQTITNILSFAGPARVAGMARSALNKIALGGSGALIAEGLTQDISELAGSKQPREFGKELAAAAFGAGAEAIGPAREALRTRKLAKGLGTIPEEVGPALENVAKAEAAETATGIPLYRAQKSAVPSEVERQSFVSQLPAGSQRAMRALSEQNKAAGDAVEQMLTTLAPPESITRGAERFRSAAGKAVKAKTRARSEAASPIYKQAFRRQRQGKLAPIDTSALETKLDRMAKQFHPEGQIAKNLKKAQDKINNAGGDLQKLHLAKTELDQTINNFGADSVGRTTKRFITDAKNDLTNNLVEQSPSYSAARDEFVRMSPAVEKIEGSVVGKISKLDESQLKDVSNKIFNPSETNTRVVSEAKSAIDAVDPDAWNDLLRVHLEGKLGTAIGDIGDTAFSVENAPSILHKAIFGNAKQKAILYKALNPEQMRNFKYLETALDRARLGRPGGSQTGIRKEISREFDKGFVQSLRDFITAPIKTVAGVGEEAARNQRIRSVAEAMFDPSYKAEIRKIRAMNPNKAVAGKAMSQVLNQINLNLGADNIIDESE